MNISGCYCSHILRLKMADAAAKKKRTTSLGKFTRNLNTLNDMLDNASPKCIVTPQYEKLCNCWNTLEDAHDAFIEITDIDIEIEFEK